MPFITSYTLPATPSAVAAPTDPRGAFFLVFVASNMPGTDQSWCPDVCAALPYINAAFTAKGAPDAAVVEVGQRPEWRVPTNVFRTKWNVHSVPTVVRFQSVDGEVKETGRLVEDEILDQKRLRALLYE